MAWKLEIHTIDVKQGESSLIIAKNIENKEIIDYKTILIDGGRACCGKYIHHYLKINIFDMGMDLNYVLLTHFDDDHSSGIVEILLADNFSNFIKNDLRVDIKKYIDYVNRNYKNIDTKRYKLLLSLAIYLNLNDKTDDIIKNKFLTINNCKDNEIYEETEKLIKLRIVEPDIDYFKKFNLISNLIDKISDFESVNKKIKLKEITDDLSTYKKFLSDSLLKGKISPEIRDTFWTDNKYNHVKVIDTGKNGTEMDAKNIIKHCFREIVNGGFPYYVSSSKEELNGDLWLDLELERTRGIVCGTIDEINNEDGTKNEKIKIFNIEDDIFELGENAPKLYIMAGNKNFFTYPKNANSLTTENNHISIGLLLKYKKFTFFTAGDLEDKYEDNIARSLMAYSNATDTPKDKYIMNNLTAFKCGHHGSASATSNFFLDTLKPKFAIISCGAVNTFAHPTFEVLDRLFLAKSMDTILLTNSFARINIPKTYSKFYLDIKDQVSVDISKCIDAFVKDLNTRPQFSLKKDYADKFKKNIPKVITEKFNKYHYVKLKNDEIKCYQDGKSIQTRTALPDFLIANEDLKCDAIISGDNKDIELSMNIFFDQAIQGGMGNILLLVNENAEVNICKSIHTGTTHCTKPAEAILMAKRKDIDREPLGRSEVEEMVAKEKSTKLY